MCRLDALAWSNPFCAWGVFRQSTHNAPPWQRIALLGGKRCSRQDSAMKVGTLPDAERTQSITNLPFPTKPHVLDWQSR